MAIDSTSSHGPTRGYDIETYWKMIAASRLGAAPKEMLWFFHNAAARGSQDLGAGGGGDGTEAVVAGAYKMSTGVTGGSFRRVYAWGATIVSKMVRDGQPWWIGGRFKISSTIASGTKLGVGLASVGANFVAAVGASAAVSTTNFSLFAAAGTAIDSGQALDSSYHDHEGFRVGSTTTYAIDSVSKGTSADADINEDTGPFAMVLNTGDAADRIIELVWFAAATKSV